MKVFELNKYFCEIISLQLEYEGSSEIIHSIPAQLALSSLISTDLYDGFGWEKHLPWKFFPNFISDSLMYMGKSSATENLIIDTLLGWLRELVNLVERNAVLPYDFPSVE